MPILTFQGIEKSLVSAENRTMIPSMLSNHYTHRISPADISNITTAFLKYIRKHSNVIDL
jgi:hypothetical protein